MNNSSSSSHNQDQHHQSRPPYNGRAATRVAVYHIICQPMLEQGSRPRYHLTKKERLKARGQSRLIEDILYKRASCVEDLQDESTLEDWVIKAGHAIYRNVQLRQQQLQRERGIQS